MALARSGDVVFGALLEQRVLDRLYSRRSADPKTAVQTTKHTKHTKNEALTKRTLLPQPAGTSVGRNLRQFGYFESFVVPTELSPWWPRRGEAWGKPG